MLGAPKAYVSLRRPGRRSRRRGLGDRGITMMETLVSVMLFAIAFVFLFQMLFSGRALVELEGDRRAALKFARYKTEELKFAGYLSSGDDSDWTSTNLDTDHGDWEIHPDDPTVVMDTQGTETTGDDLVGSMTWAVKETVWVYDGAPTSGQAITIDGKVVDLKVEWPLGDPFDEVRLRFVIIDS
jgi:hypothetical protein